MSLFSDIVIPLRVNAELRAVTPNTLLLLSEIVKPGKAPLSLASLTVPFIVTVS